MKLSFPELKNTPWHYLPVFYALLLLLGFYLIYFTPLSMPVQIFETVIVYELYKASGVPATLRGDLISISLGDPVYRRIYISAQCTALFEMYIVILSAYFIGRDRRSLKDGMFMAMIIFSENIARIYLSYFIISSQGYEEWSRLHYVWWYYGHLVLIIFLLLLWSYIRGYLPLRVSRTPR